MGQGRIEVNPAILVGKPVLKETRLAVEFLLELMAEGWSTDEILRNDPQLTAGDLRAATRNGPSFPPNFDDSRQAGPNPLEISEG